MKKIGILFIFFALIFGLVLLPEVYGINVDDWNYEMEQAEKDCADNAMKIIIRQNGYTYYEEIKDNNRVSDTEKKIIDINLSPNKLATNQKIEVFIFTEEKDFATAGKTNYDKNKFEVEKVSGGAADKNQLEATETDGNPSWILWSELICKEEGNYNFKFNATGFDTNDEKNPSVYFQINLTFATTAGETSKPSFKMVDSIEGWKTEGKIAEAALDDGGIKVIVRQGKYTYVTKEYKDNVINSIEKIDIELPKKIAKNEDIDVFIYTEEEGLHTVSSSIGYSVSRTKTPKSGSDSSIETEVAFDKVGSPALMGLTKIKCKENGNYGFLFQITGHDVKNGEKAHESVNFSIQINFEVSNSGDKNGTYVEAQYVDGKVEGWEEEEKKAEDVLDSGDVRIIVKQKGLTVYQNNGITDDANDRKLGTFGIDAEVEIGTDIEIFIYTEEIGLLDLEDFNGKNKFAQMYMSAASYYEKEIGGKKLKNVEEMKYKYHFSSNDNDSLTTLTTANLRETGEYNILFTFKCPYDECINFSLQLTFNNVVEKKQEYLEDFERVIEYWKGRDKNDNHLAIKVLDQNYQPLTEDPIIKNVNERGSIKKTIDLTGLKIEEVFYIELYFRYDDMLGIKEPNYTYDGNIFVEECDNYTNFKTGLVNDMFTEDGYFIKRLKVIPEMYAKKLTIIQPVQFELQSTDYDVSPWESVTSGGKKWYNLYVEILFKIGTGSEGEENTFVDATENPDYFKPSDVNDMQGVDELKNKIGIILTVITNIGMIVSVLMPAILGVKYMLGSIEEKAEFKKDMVPYLIGAVLLFSICTIIKFLQLIGNDINNA